MKANNHQYKCINCNDALCDGIHCRIREQLGYALDLADIGLWEWDILTDIVTFSQESKGIIGMESDESTVTLESLFDRIIHPDSRDSFIQAVGEMKQKGHLSDGTYAVVREDGVTVWVQIKGIITYDPLGHATGIKGILKNVTETHNKAIKLGDELNFIETVLEAIPSPFFYKNSEGRYKFFNTAFMEYLGLSYDELYDATVYDIALNELAQIYDQADKALMVSKEKQVYETEVVYADGSLRPVKFVKAAHVDKEGQVLGLIGLMEDISKRKLEEARSMIGDRMKESIVQLNNNITNYQDEEAFFQDVLYVFEELLGKTSQSTILEITEDNLVHIKTSRGYDLEDIHRFEIPVEETFIYKENNGKLDTACIINDLSKYLMADVKPEVVTDAEAVIMSSLEIPIVIEDRVKYIFSMDSLERYVFDENDLFVGNYIRTQFQILYRVFSLYQSTLYMSRHDVMCGVMNRGYLDQSLERAMSEADKSGRYFYTVLFDLDGLKQINDIYGHIIGDQYILRFSTYLKKNFGEEDRVGRVGGDEFVCLIYDLSYDEIIDKIEAMREGFISEVIHTDQGDVSGSFSYGVEQYKGVKMSLKALIKSADAQMYQYKNKNKMNEGPN